MRFLDDLHLFSTQHPYLSIGTLGIGTLVGVLGYRIVRWIKDYCFPGSQQVDAVARKTLASNSSALVAASPTITAENAAFEEGLKKWLDDPTEKKIWRIPKGKLEAAKRIRNVNSSKETSLNLRGIKLDLNDPFLLFVLTAMKIYFHSLKTLPPQIGQLNALTYLDVSRNQLTALPPQIGQLNALTHLDVASNRLTVLPPEIGQLNALNRLYVGNNSLTTLPPEIGQLTALTSLCISLNQLTTLPPEIGQLNALNLLFGVKNRLTALPPEIGQLTALSGLDFSGNRELSDLPISLGNLPEITYLNNDGTQVPDSIVGAILASCRAKRRYTANVDALPYRLDLWKGYAKQFNNQEFDLAHILDLEENEKNEVSEWLLRLSKTSEFKHAQKELAEKACAMLKAIKDYPEFKSIFLGQIALNNEACGDRAAQAFNELYVLYRIYTLDANVPLKDKLLILQGCAKTMALREAIRMRIKAHESAGNGEVREDVEIYLYYETNLREELGLITAIKSMIYGQIGKRDWINIETLRQDVNANNMTILSEMEAVQKIAQKDEALKEKWDAVSDKFADRMDELDPKKFSNKAYLAEVDNIEVERANALSELTREWVEKEMK